MFESFGLEIPRAGASIPSYVKEIIGDSASIKITATEFFNTIHVWFPILSKTKFYSQVLNPLSQLRADVALLIMSIKLLTWYPSKHDSAPRTLLYKLTKRFYSEIEESGIGSVQVLQAGIFIALYEFGHAIYPAAYLSTGACARLGVMFGFDRNEVDGQGWMDVEERKRAWWGVLILDR
jgi:Fungal specific transcription factor domain